jgi:hypothetical protein
MTKYHYIVQEWNEEDGEFIPVSEGSGTEAVIGPALRAVADSIAPGKTVVDVFEEIKNWFYTDQAETALQEDFRSPEPTTAENAQAYGRQAFNKAHDAAVVDLKPWQFHGETYA